MQARVPKVAQAILAYMAIVVGLTIAAAVVTYTWPTLWGRPPAPEVPATTPESRVGQILRDSPPANLDDLVARLKAGGQEATIVTVVQEPATPGGGEGENTLHLAGEMQQWQLPGSPPGDYRLPQDSWHLGQDGMVWAPAPVPKPPELSPLRARALIDIETEMTVGDVYIAHMVVERGVGDKAEAFIEDKGGGRPEVDLTIEAADLLNATAWSGAGLRVNQVGGQPQSIAQGGLAVWVWNVEPVRPGQSDFTVGLWERKTKAELASYVDAFPQSITVTASPPPPAPGIFSPVRLKWVFSELGAGINTLAGLVTIIGFVRPAQVVHVPAPDKPGDEPAETRAAARPGARAADQHLQAASDGAPTRCRRARAGA